MGSLERIVSRPERAAVRRAEAAESHAKAEAGRADRAEQTAREMKAERDEWKAQAEKAVAELARFRVDLIDAHRALTRAIGEPYLSARPQRAPRELPAENDPTAKLTRRSEFGGGLLHGYDAIAAHLGIGTEAARYRARSEGMPLAKSGRRVWIRQDTLNAWLADREAASTGGANG